MFFNKSKTPVSQKKSYSISQLFRNLTDCSTTFSNLQDRKSLELYLSTPPVRKSVEIISNLASVRSPIIRDKTSQEIINKKEILSFLKNTSFGISFKEFMWNASVNYLTTAKNYFLLVKSVSGKPLNLYNISPAEITQDVSNGLVESYTRTVEEVKGSKKIQSQIVYYRKETVDKGFRVSFVDKDGNELWQMKEYNPLYPLEGKSKISTLYDSIQGFNVAGRHNRKLIENGCSPSGFLFSKNELTDADYQNLKDNFSSNYSGENNAGKPILLQGDLEFKEAHISPREMDWIAGRKLDERIIYDTFGIPQAFVNNEASSYNNLTTSSHMFYEQTIFPLLDKIYGELTDLLVVHFDKSENLEIYYSKEGIISLDSIKTEATLNKSKTGIYKINELRTENGLEEIEEGNVLLNSAKAKTEEPLPEAKDYFIELMQKDGYNNKQIKHRIEELEKEGLL